MKKFFGVLVLVSLMGCMVACGDKTIKPDNVNNENVGTVQSGEVQKEEKVYFDKNNLNVFADVQTIVMPENPTTGYTWTYLLDNAEVAKVQRDEFVQNSGDEGFVGVGGNRVMEIVGLAEGETTLKCEYMRGWEEAPIETVVYKISVNADGQIAITNEAHG